MTFRSFRVLWVNATLLAAACSNPSVPGVSTPDDAGPIPETGPEDRGAAPGADAGLVDREPDPGPDDAGYGIDDAGESETSAPPDAVEVTTPLTDEEGCADIFAQSILPTYEVSISSENWAAIYTEFKTRYNEETGGGQPRTEYPITFRYGDEVVSDATLRLKGQSSWRQSATLDTPGKMQFVVSFNSVSSGKRFHGQRKIELDMPRADRTFLRQRLAFAFLRHAAIPAPCANSARLVVNGTFYGLYANTERMDKTFLSRVFPGAAGGDLWDGGQELKTNELTATWDRRNALFAAHDLATIDGLVDLQQAVSEWAAEAVMPDGDGYYGSGHNFYLYDHPTRGFLWLPHDKDSTFDRRAFDIDPYLWSRKEQPHTFYLTVLADPTWFGVYRAELARMLELYDVALLQRWQATWAEQIAASAQEDTNKPPITDAEHRRLMGEQQAYFARRASFLRDWLTCQADGSGATDADGDGVPFCRDCADTDATIRPGGTEVCGNQLDDDCDGLIDEGC
ncbi:MAG TPA: CotH kinase family protein [Polyangia bacterium]|jgi:hypothetical protein|nr:CotH kinase family protein [Polyangia bacterium]